MLGAIASIAHYGGYQWLLPAEVRMAEPVGGLIAFGQADLKEHCLAGLAWAQRLLQGNGGDTVEDGLTAERAAGQLAISNRCISSLELPGDTQENAAQELSNLAARVGACRSNDCQLEPLAAELDPIITRLRATSSIRARKP